MNNFFRRLPFPVKLMLIGLIPLLFLVYISIQLYNEKTQKVKLLKGYINRIYQSAYINTLIDYLQNERKFSFDFAMRKEWQHELTLQRPRTDSVIKQLEVQSDLALADFRSYTFLNNLQNVRNQVDSGKIGPNQVMHYYSTMVYRLNTLNAVSPGSEIHLQPVYKDLIAQKLLSEMITSLGIIRSNIYNVLYTKQYMIETLIGMVGVHDVYKTYETEFLIKASPFAIESYKKIRNNTLLKPTVEYIDSLFKRFSFDSSYNAERWWKVSNDGVQTLVNLQQNIWSSVTEGMNNILKKEQNARNRTLILLSLALVFVIGFVIYTIRIISSILTELELAAQKISKGETGLKLKIVSNDVIGTLAESICKIEENNKLLAEAANEIGKGNFDVPLQPRSSADLLGNAIIRMKEELQEFTAENEKIKEQFRQLADFMPQIVWTARPDGFLDYYNKRWYEFTGFREEYGDQSWMPVLHADDAQFTTDTWSNSVKTGEPFQIEYRFKDRRTGGYKWFLGKALPIKDEFGKIIKWFGTCTEIQNQKTFSEQLERKVKERTQALNQANAELERSNRDLEQFAYIASHDLQEPVRKIRMFSEYIRELNYNRLEENSKKYLDKVCSSAERMKNIITDLLDFASLNRDKQQFAPTDLNEVLLNVKADLELLINQKKAVIESDPLPVIEANPLQMNQLVYNLINNSLKFTIDGKPPVIRISTRKPDRASILKFPSLDPHIFYCEIIIQDNGVGFEQKYAQQIFSMFQRLDRKNKYTGTGIGLALCKKIVENHDGAIEAQSEPGEGATFRIFLPFK